MSRLYSNPVLLIEFDENKEFATPSPASSDPFSGPTDYSLHTKLWCSLSLCSLFFLSLSLSCLREMRVLCV